MLMITANPDGTLQRVPIMLCDIERVGQDEDEAEQIQQWRKDTTYSQGATYLTRDRRTLIVRTEP